MSFIRNVSSEPYHFTLKDKVLKNFLRTFILSILTLETKQLKNFFEKWDYCEASLFNIPFLKVTQTLLSILSFLGQSEQFLKSFFSLKFLHFSKFFNNAFQPVNVYKTETVKYKMCSKSYIRDQVQHAMHASTSRVFYTATRFSGKDSAQVCSFPEMLGFVQGKRKSYLRVRN